MSVCFWRCNWIAVLFTLISTDAAAQFFQRFDSAVKDSTCYVITTGNKSKTALIAGQFNLKDSVSTHVGLVLKVDGRNMVFHVTDSKAEINAFKIEPLEAFLSAEHVFYASLWRIQLPTNDYISILAALDDFQLRPIRFDFSFETGNGDSLYCSEFCAAVLMQSENLNLHFRPVRKELPEFHRSVLERESLVYYPVDFFQNSTSFSKLFEAFK